MKTRSHRHPIGGIGDRGDRLVRRVNVARLSVGALDLYGCRSAARGHHFCKQGSKDRIARCGQVLGLWPPGSKRGPGRGPIAHADLASAVLTTAPETWGQTEAERADGRA